MATTAASYRSTQNGYQPSYIPAAIAAGLVFVLYFITIAPSIAMWDTGEYMAAAKVLGLPHPPGNPFFMLLGHVFGQLPLPGSYAAADQHDGRACERLFGRLLVPDHGADSRALARRAAGSATSARRSRH